MNRTALNTFSSHQNRNLKSSSQLKRQRLKLRPFRLKLRPDAGDNATDGVTTHKHSPHCNGPPHTHCELRVSILTMGVPTDLESLASSPAALVAITAGVAAVVAVLLAVMRRGETKTRRATGPTFGDRPVDSARIARVMIYPVKGMGGIEVESATVTETGLKYDREWLVLDTKTGLPLDRVAFRQLARVRTSFVGDSLALDAPGLPQLLVPRDVEAYADAPVVEVSMSLQRKGRLAADASKWLQQLMNQPAPPGTARKPGDAASHTGASASNNPAAVPVGRFVLMRYDPAFATRIQDQPKYSDLVDGSRRVGFNYNSHLLVLSTSSVAALNSRLADEYADVEPLPFTRFRPNLLVEGLDGGGSAGAAAASAGAAGEPSHLAMPPHDEDTWRQLRVSRDAKDTGLQLSFFKPCARCAIISVDSLGRMPEGTKALRKMRETRLPLDTRYKESPLFGSNFLFDGARAGTVIRPGDVLEVLARSDVPVVRTAAA